MKKWIWLCFWLPLAAQNVSQRYTFTAVGDSTVFNNSSIGCAGFSLSYNSSGFTGETVTLQSSNNNATWATFDGTTVVGSNPATAITYSYYSATGYVPYVRVDVSGLSGTGQITAIFQCWKSPNYIAVLGGGGGAGPTGPSGPSGPAGATGAAGTNGTNGTNGAIGPTGPTGPAGPTGATGPAGGGGGVNTQTTSYTAIASDTGKLIVMNCSSACALTLPNPAIASWYARVESVGSTTSTINLNSLTFNGSVNVPVLAAFRDTDFFSDGTNYWGRAPLAATSPIVQTGTSNGFVTSCPTCAPFNSPAFTGIPTAPTASAGTNTTQLSTTQFTTTAINNAIAGVNPAVAVQAATTAAGDTSGLTYNNGVAGIGATFTGTANTAITIDGFTFTALNQRLLVKNDTQLPSGAFNGIYYVTTLQALGVPPILTRALDYDAPSDINNTGAIPVVNGTVNALTSWLLTSSVNTVGTDPLTYSKFSNNPASGGGTCTNQAVTAISSAGVPTCTTLSSAYVNNTIAQTGVDINTLYQIVGINGTSLAGLATGLLRNTTSTGVPTIATAAQILAACTGCAPLASPTFTGTVTLPTTSAAFLKTDSSGIVSSGTLLAIANGGAVAQGSNTCGTADLCVSGSLTQAQIVSIVSNSTFVQAIAAPASGSFIIIDNFYAESVPTATAYAGGSTMGLYWGTGGSTLQASNGTCGTAFLTTATISQFCGTIGQNAASGATSVRNGIAVYIGLGGAAYTCAGTCGTVNYWIKYHISAGL